MQNTHIYITYLTLMPMMQIDQLPLQNDDQLLMEYVICNEPDLLYLDTLLKESLNPKV